MGILGTLPPVGGLQIGDTSSDEKHPLGTIVLYKDSNGYLSVLKFVRADNATVKQHAAVKVSAATSKPDYVVQSVDADQANPGKFAGVAAATIATNKYGWVYVGGYVPDVDFSTTVASADMLGLGSGGHLKTFAVNATQAGTTAYVVAVSRGAASDALGSVQLQGLYV